MMQNNHNEEEIETSNIDYRVLSSFNNLKENDLKLLKFSCIYLNIRSMKKNWNLFISYISNIIKYLKIIILVEINIKEEENCLYQLNGFNSQFINRSNRSGGGAVIYVRDEVFLERVHINTVSYECVYIKTKINEEEMSIIAVYRPPKLNVHTFIDELENNIDQIDKKTNLIIMGDMNIDIKKDSIPSVSRYLDMIAAKGLQSMILSNTRVDLNRGSETKIDHCLTRIKQRKLYSAVIEISVADHFALFCGAYEREKNTVEQADKFIISENKVTEYLLRINWEDIYSLTNVNDFYNKFVQLFKRAYEKSNSKIKTKRRSTAHPWVTTEILNLCRQRDKMYKKWKNNRRCLQYESDYKTFRNFATKQINRIKCEYYKNKFAEYRKDLKNTWKLINNILGKSTNNLDDAIRKNFSSIEPQCIANKFATSLTTEIKSIVHTCGVKTFNGRERSSAQSMFLANVSDSEIGNMLNNLNLNKSAGIDGIRAKDIKRNRQILTPVLTHLVNTSFEQSCVPNSLKVAIVRPIYKSGAKGDILNYRPISILPTIDKILEKAMASRLQDYLEKYSIINKNQFGFMKNRNVNKLLLEFSNTVNSSLNKNYHVLVIYIDFKKAFDTLCHIRIIQMLEKIGLRSQILEWFKSYLSDRAFKVKICNTFSQPTQISYGVPQGSILGPLLFIIYVNDMLSVLKHSTGYQYADDTAIIVTHRELQTAVQTMQSEFNEVVRWCHDNGLIINANKTKLMHIRPPHIPRTHIEIKFHNFECLHQNVNHSCLHQSDNCKDYIENVDVYRYLGIEVDCNFKWDAHIKQLCNRLRKSTYALYHLSYHTSYPVLKQVYFSLVESILHYGIVAWGNTSPYMISELQRSQNRIFKILHRAKHGLHYGENSAFSSNDLGLLTIKEFFVFNLINELYHDQRFKKPLQHSINTRRRAQGYLQTPRIHNSYGRQQLEFVVPKVFNKLPRNLWDLQPKSARKNAIKKYILSNSISTF